MLSFPIFELLLIIRWRPPESAAVDGDRYSVAHEHVACDSPLRRPPSATARSDRRRSHAAARQERPLCDGRSGETAKDANRLLYVPKWPRCMTMLGRSAPRIRECLPASEHVRAIGKREVTVKSDGGEYMAPGFNPPPGWPPSPPGWQPGPNWQPDPSWPKPPVGWSFWIDEPVAALQAQSGQAVQVRAATAPAPLSSLPSPVQPSFSSQPPSGRHATLTSEQVVIAAPMSFAGSAQRLAKLPRSVASPYLRLSLWVLTVVLIAMVWTFVLAWYLTWGLWLVPYRIIRRGQRKQKVERLRHREMIERLDRRQ